MMAVEIGNCDLAIRFNPEIIYPGEYRVLGRCFPMERKTGSKQLATVQIDGSDINKLTAKCLTSDCPLRMSENVVGAHGFGPWTSTL